MSSQDHRDVHPDDRGATSIEYSLTASLIAMAVLVAVALLGLNVLALFNLMPAGL
jgi:Flp pilus assembly pilin Flp